MHRKALFLSEHAIPAQDPRKGTRTESDKSTKQVQRIKERVEEKEGIPPPQQRLIYGGKQM